jgi:hypothetical protein
MLPGRTYPVTFGKVVLRNTVQECRIRPADRRNVSDVVRSEPVANCSKLSR